MLEPIIARGSLVFNEDIPRDEEKSLQRYPVEKRPSYSLLHQIAHITRDKNALQHDDRLDAIAGACRYWVEQMPANTRTHASLSTSVQLVPGYPHLIRSGSITAPLRPPQPFRLPVYPLECLTVSRLSQGLSCALSYAPCPLPQRGNPQRCNGAIARPRTRLPERAHAQARTGSAGASGWRKAAQISKPNLGREVADVEQPELESGHTPVTVNRDWPCNPSDVGERV